jgi:hypothetical protein
VEPKKSLKVVKYCLSNPKVRLRQNRRWASPKPQVGFSKTAGGLLDKTEGGLRQKVEYIWLHLF